MPGFPFQKILMIGATSGIGWAMAAKLLSEGRSVVIVGRRQDRLNDFVEAHKQRKDRISTKVFDVLALEAIPDFVKQITTEHPDLDAIWHNSGIQRGFNFAVPKSVDLSVVGAELTTNYTSAIHIITAFLPFLMKKPHASIIATTSGLAIVPLGRCPNYCATKAALHMFLMCLRGHLTGTSVRVIEVMPPAVQTELHDEKYQPDIKNGREIGMRLDAYVEETWQDLVTGSQYDEYPGGLAKGFYQTVELPRRKASVLPLEPAGVDS